MQKFLYILLGAFILSTTLYQVNFQNEITEGGVLGFILLIQALFLIPPPITSLVTDTTLFLFGSSVYGKQFLVRSVFASISFSLLYTLNEHIGFVIPNFGEFKLMAAIIAGLGVGLGVGLIVQTNAASAGDDALALIISKVTPLKIGHVYLMIDFFILTASLSYLSFTDIMYSFIAVCISGRVINFMYDRRHQYEETLAL